MFSFSWPQLLTTSYRGNIVLLQDIIETLGHCFFCGGGRADPVGGQQFLPMGWTQGRISGYTLVTSPQMVGISCQNQKPLVEALKCKLESQISCERCEFSQ